jgi:AcrR family transcriptional regulator
MDDMTAVPDASAEAPVQAPRLRRKRGSLSPEEITAAALSLLDAEGASALTFARLGVTLQASPTAVYRHFASRQEVIVAVAEELDAISLDGYESSGDWRADLEDLAWRAWRTALAHPAAASIAMSLITNGPNELRAVDAVLAALHAAGLRGRDAVLQYQVYSNLVLGAAASHGERLASVDGEAAAEGWVQVYAPANPSRYPYATRVADELRRIDYEEVFGAQVQMFLDALTVVLD